LGTFGPGGGGFATHSLPTQYCCPVSGPAAPSLGRVRRLAPAAMQASCCSSVSASLKAFEAAARRAQRALCVCPIRHFRVPGAFLPQSRAAGPSRSPAGRRLASGYTSTRRPEQSRQNEALCCADGFHSHVQLCRLRRKRRGDDCVAAKRRARKAGPGPAADCHHSRLVNRQ
jgi:hypothetical protein